MLTFIAGHYHSFRHGVHKAFGGSSHEDVEIEITKSHSAPKPSYAPNTVTIPCHHIRLGDLLMLQGRPCQVIKITTSSATGQHRYLGVDLFTKQLHEESSFVSNPSPSVVVQTMLGPVFKQYRVLDLQDGSVVAMTETVGSPKLYSYQWRLTKFRVMWSNLFLLSTSPTYGPVLVKHSNPAVGLFAFWLSVIRVESSSSIWKFYTALDFKRIYALAFLEFGNWGIWGQDEMKLLNGYLECDVPELRWSLRYFGVLRICSFADEGFLCLWYWSV